MLAYFDQLKMVCMPYLKRAFSSARRLHIDSLFSISLTANKYEPGEGLKPHVDLMQFPGLRRHCVAPVSSHHEIHKGLIKALECCWSQEIYCSCKYKPGAVCCLLSHCYL